MFLSTPHGGFESVDVLKDIGVSAYKFGSADLQNLPVLQYAARHNKPIKTDSIY
jgi:sialic acid synthase SpsE